MSANYKAHRYVIFSILLLFSLSSAQILFLSICSQIFSTYEECELLGSDAVYFGRSSPMFRGNVSFPSSGSKSKPNKKPTIIRQHEARRHNPKDHTLHSNHCDNLKSNLFCVGFSFNVRGQVLRPHTTTNKMYRFLYFKYISVYIFTCGSSSSISLSCDRSIASSKVLERDCPGKVIMW
jgi:hypothetical protein